MHVHLYIKFVLHLHIYKARTSTMAGRGRGRGRSYGSTARLGKPHESTREHENIMKRRNARFLASKMDQNPMELLTSPSRGLDTVVDSSMLGLHSKSPGISAKYVYINNNKLVPSGSPK